MPQQMISVENLAQALVQIAGNSQQGGNMRYKAAPGTPDASYMHGFGGLFNTPGLDRRVFSAMGLPGQGLLSRLPAVPSVYDSPLYPILTGQTASTGSEPATECSVWPEVGNLKRCAQSFPFGKMGRATQVINLTRVGRMTNSGETVDFQLIGNPFGPPDQAGAMPTIPGMPTGNAVLNNEIGVQMFKLGVAFQRDFASDIYQGNPANNVGGGAGNGRKYFYGLENLVKAGYRDAVAGTACPAADSLVRSFGGRNISTDNTAGAALVSELVYEVRNRQNIARHIGVAATWAFVMREEAFYEVTAVWPCSYYTNRCSTSLNAGAPVDGKALTDMRDEMRAGQFLWVDGKKVEVILDDSVPETEPAPGQFQSDIYLLPLTVDGIPVLYLEYFKYDMANGPVAAAQAFGMSSFFIATDGGRFLLTRQAPTGTCVQFQMESETRLILRTPFLATRLYGVRYTPLIHNHEYQPSSTYFYNGGITNTTGLGPSFYSPTA